MARADILMSGANNSARAAQSNYIVIDGGGNLYNFIYSSVDGGLYWQASYDGGFTWSFKRLIKAIGTAGSFAVWFDQWTPGVSSTTVHLAYFDPTNDDVSYRSFDLSSETLGTEVLIYNGASTGAIASTCISITKAIGGNLYVAYDIDGGTETGFYRSVDSGANWTSRSDVNEPPGSDYYLLAPGFAADTQDIICIYWDRSASEISRKLYDDSANSWSESSIATSMTAIANTTSTSQFSISVDDANNKILLVAWSNRNTVNADLRFWTVDESSITEGTNVVLNSGGNQASCSISLVNSSGLLYCFYVGKSDGSETIGTSVHVYYKTSSDGGTTWGSETVLTTLKHNYDYLYTVPVIVDITGRFFAAFEDQESTLDEMLISCVFPSSGGNNVAAPILDGYILQ